MSATAIIALIAQIVGIVSGLSGVVRDLELDIDLGQKWQAVRELSSVLVAKAKRLVGIHEAGINPEDDDPCYQGDGTIAEQPRAGCPVAPLQFQG